MTNSLSAADPIFAGAGVKRKKTKFRSSPARSLDDADFNEDFTRSRRLEKIWSTPRCAQRVDCRAKTF